MLFNSIEFITVFLPVVLIVFFGLGRLGRGHAAMAWLVAASFFFYGWWNPKYLVLILVSILFNFGMGRLLGGSSSADQAGSLKAKFIMLMGVAANLVALAYFKYANFFIENLNTLTQSNYHLESIVLPLAIWFFTFQQIAYLVDAYQGNVTDCTFIQYCIFVTFFPQLIAGPIVHHKEVLPQFAEPSIYRFSSDNLGDGLATFCIGMFKKAVLADGLSPYVGPVFMAAEQGSEITFFVAWAAVLAYTFQLYFDFSGYSDMAIGIGRMFNIRLPVNFASPYKSVNIIEFWRRWHITLSCFLRDYLYIPLGGSRKGKWRRYLNLMLTMVIGGLWHGASWTFVAWGTLHGAYLIINHVWRRMRQAANSDLGKSSFAGRLSGRTLTFLAVILAWT